MNQRVSKSSLVQTSMKTKKTILFKIEYPLKVSLIDHMPLIMLFTTISTTICGQKTVDFLKVKWKRKLTNGPKAKVVLKLLTNTNR